MSHPRPALKNNIDVQLQNAFTDGNWPSVIRLADRRAKAQHDPYYETIKVCAESQLDNPAERCAARVAVDDLIRSGAAPKDVESLDLYEWACPDLQSSRDYTRTLGLLRSKWLKENPRSPAGTSCFQACLRRWDLVNAQRISAILDKSSASSDRRFMYWSIALTHLLSISTQCPEGQHKIYGMLALKQIERAADGVGKTEHNGAGSDRVLQSEEEFLLYYRVLAHHGSAEGFAKTVRNPKLGALKQLQEGRKQLFLEALTILEAQGQWSVVYDLCHQALGGTGQNGPPSTLAADWRLWKLFVESAGKQSDQEAAFTEVQTVLQRFVGAKSKVAKMHVKNVALALLDTAFHMPTSTMATSRSNAGATPRVSQLCLFIDQHADKASIFVDIKCYVEILSFSEAKLLLDTLLPRMSREAPDFQQKISCEILQQMLRYLLTTCPQSLIPSPAVLEAGQTVHQCKLCGAPTSSDCHGCLQAIFQSIVELRGQIAEGSSNGTSGSHVERDQQASLSLVACMLLLKSAGLRQITGASRNSQVLSTKPSRLIQAVLLLDKQLSVTPDDVGLRLLLTKLYVLIGCGTLAYQAWLPMDVKRTIQDALSPLFFDRMSSMSPGLLHSQAGRPLTEPLKSYYRTSLRDRAPVKLWDAFIAGSYSSILDMAAFNDRLRQSCTRVMTVMEDRRASRAFGGRLEELDDVALFADIAFDTGLVDVTDSGGLPNLENSHGPSLAELLQLGPGLSSIRSHLDMLSERYLDLISFRPAKEYKPSKAGEAATGERTCAVEMFVTLNSSFMDILQLAEAPSHLTTAEVFYFSILSHLSALLHISLASHRAEPIQPTFLHLSSSLKSTLGSLRATCLATPPTVAMDRADVFHALTNRHAMSVVREAALALKQSAGYIIAVNEREMARDRSGKSNLHKEVVSEMRELQALGSRTLEDVRNHNAYLQEELGQPGWLERVSRWALLSHEHAADDSMTKGVLELVGERTFIEEWAGRVLESWREGAEEWSRVQME